MGSSGWMGRLKLAARAIDLRLKAVPERCFMGDIWGYGGCLMIFGDFLKMLDDF